MSVVIVGAGSYTGFNLVKKISKDRETLAVISNKNTNTIPREFYNENNIKTLSSIESLLSEKLSQKSIIIYLGGYSSSDHTFTDIEKLTRAYITGVSQSLEVARKFGCPIVIVGSYWELLSKIGNNSNINLYSAIQASQNKILEFFAYEYGISITKIFQADTYGPNDWRPKLLSAVINSIKNNKVLNVGSPNQIIAPIYISDVIGDLIDIMDSASFGENLLNQVQLMPDKVYTLKKFIDKIEIVTQKTVLVNWNTKANIRADIENFPIIKNIHKNKNKRVILEEGLNEVLRII